VKPAPQVHVANVNGDLVFLDATRNRYVCLPRSQACEIVRLLAGDDAVCPNPILAELVAAGLLREGADFRADRVAAPSATSDLHACTSMDPGPTWRSFVRLAIAAARTAFDLAISSPGSWLSRPQRDLREDEVETACRLARQFERIRPLVPRTGSCLPGSLMLLAFLRGHGVAARLVFGVQTFPFEAHCWVQVGTIVLNDTLEHVRWFTPIASS
jgi:hypothetical protein